GQEAAIQIGERNANGRILKDRSPALLTLSQSLFRSPTLSTVRRRSATFRFVLIWLSTQHVVSFCGCSTDRMQFLHLERTATKKLRGEVRAETSKQMKCENAVQGSNARPKYLLADHGTKIQTVGFSL